MRSISWVYLLTNPETQTWEITRWLNKVSETGLGLQILIVITNILAFNNISARIFNWTKRHNFK